LSSKILQVLACVALASAAPEAPGYSYPSAPSGGYDAPSNNGNIGGGSFVGNVNQGGQTYRHVYVHVAPDEPVDEQSRVIRVPGGQDKHVNIIFVKTPSASSQAQTEVILPEQDEQKTIVYVLNRKFNAETDLKIRAPRPTTPTKPDVYFIRYKDNQGATGVNVNTNNNNNNGPSRPVYGAPSF